MKLALTKLIVKWELSFQGNFKSMTKQKCTFSYVAFVLQCNFDIYFLFEDLPVFGTVKPIFNAQSHTFDM
jgi:hypothetical protein